jgi:bla regulator protein blaR1
MNLIFFIKFIILTGIVYSVYRLTLDNTNQFLVKRIILISTPVILTFASLVTIQTGVEIIPLDNIVFDTYDSRSSSSAKGIDINQIVWIIYIVGLIVSAISKGIGLIRLNLLFSKRNIVNRIGNIGIYTNKRNYNLSFFNKILIDDKLTQYEKHKVIDHELIHIEKNHSIDNLIFTLYEVIFWFNPIVYLMHKELRMTHEFEVDNELCSSEFEIISPNTKRMIYSTIANNYTFNNIKRRLEMRNNNNNRKLPIVYAIMTTIILSTMMIIGTNNTYAGDKTEVTKQPSYNGDMMSTLVENIKYPKSAFEDGIEGRTIVQLTISKEGTIKNTSVAQSSGNKELDEEAMRAAEFLKEWTPGEKDGKKIDVAVQIPIKFKLPKEE